MGSLNAEPSAVTPEGVVEQVVAAAAPYVLRLQLAEASVVAAQEEHRRFRELEAMLTRSRVDAVLEVVEAALGDQAPSAADLVAAYLAGHPEVEPSG